LRLWVDDLSAEDAEDAEWWVCESAERNHSELTVCPVGVVVEIGPLKTRKRSKEFLDGVVAKCGFSMKIVGGRHAGESDHAG
jgi:hypothetical protein